MGIVNGGLGLQLAGASDTMKLAYTIVAAVLGGSWLILSLLAEARRVRGKDVFGRQKADPTRTRKVGTERVDKSAREESIDNGRDGRRYV